MLQPLVRESKGITFVGVPNFGGLYGTDITPKVTKKWPRPLVPRVWVMSYGEAVQHFGPRTKCRNTSWIDLRPGFLTPGRRGAVSHLLFLPSFWEIAPIESSSERLQSYCVETVAQ